MSRTFSLRVEGLPATAGSHKAYPVRRKDGRAGVAVTHALAATQPWMEVVMTEAISALGRVRSRKYFDVILNFSFLVPDSYRTKKGMRKGAPKYPSSDVDKLSRAVLDALTGVLWVNDNQVVDLTARKRWDEWQGVTVQAWEIEE